MKKTKPRFFAEFLSGDLRSGDIRAIGSLLTQLVSGNETRKSFIPELITRRYDSWLVVVRNQNQRIVGMGSLFFISTLVKDVGLIEDVVVDRRYRSKGVGRLITQQLIDQAKRQNCCVVELTSSPKRMAANRMYRKMGFKRRRTNCYQMDLRRAK